jgi:hypothetical protein
MYSDRIFNLDSNPSCSTHKAEQRAALHHPWVRRLATCLLVMCISLGTGFLPNNSARALPLPQTGELTVGEGHFLLAQSNLEDN